MFPFLQEFLTVADINKLNVIRTLNVIRQRFSTFIENFDHCYPKSEEENPRQEDIGIIDPFTKDVDYHTLTLRKKESLAELSSDICLKSRFKTSH